MKSRLFVWVPVLSVLLFGSCRTAQKTGLFTEDSRQKIGFNSDWKFFRGDSVDARLPEFNDSAWRTLQLPHDWSIEDVAGKHSPVDHDAPGGISTGYYSGGTGWYRKHFTVPEKLRGKTFKIIFEGVYMNADVWINGLHLGNHPYGYTSFEMDLTDYISYDRENVIAVQVKNEGRNSRWYSGSGIYRNVWLTVSNPLYLKTWGTALTTTQVDGNRATVVLSSEIIKGGCMHHDNGPLGAAAYDRAEERRVELMKASGFNAIRCAHNPPSVAFLNACDRLGMLVIDEAFDMWRRPKNPQDYHLYFDEHWKKDIQAMVHRDRNHPSVIMWSIGNEIPERAEAEGVATSQMLADYVRLLDPSRPVTAAVNGLNPDKDPYFATLDVSGYNYSFGGDHGKKSIFAADHERVPQRIMYCAESYPLEAFGAWMDAVNHSYVLGDFVWTGFDYLGEASIGWRGYPHDENFYPWNHAYCGDIDICGFKRPQSYYRDVLWETGIRLSVFVKPPVPSFPEKENRASWSKWHWHDHVADWNWEGYENQPVQVVVYSGYPEVELFLNGKSLGRKKTNKGNQFMAVWDVPYQPGELKAVARNETETVAESILKSAAKPVTIKLTADRDSISANGTDLSFISFELLDEQNVRHPKAENQLRFELAGPGEIIAVASSNPMSTESFQQPYRKAWQGRGLVVVRAGSKKGKITLKATSSELKPAEIVIVAQ